MRRKRLAISSSIVLASLLALSCNNSYGIFKDVQGQTKQNGSAVFRETAAYQVSRFGNYYYASTARLYQRAVSGSSWSQVSVGGSSSYYLRSFAVVGSTMYALTGDSSSDVAMYSTTDGSTWTSVAIPSGCVFDTFYVANGILFVVDHIFSANASTATGTSTYTLYYLNGSSFNTVAGFINIGETIRGVVYGNSGFYSNAKYYFAAETSFYTSDDPANSTNSATYQSPSGKEIWSIAFTGTSGSGGTGQHFYIGLTNGNLYQDYPNNTGYDDVCSIPLSCTIEVPNNSTSMLLLAGTDTIDSSDTALGYYEGSYGGLVSGSTNAIVASSSSIFNSTVYDFPVHSFYWDSAAGNLFVCISPGCSSSSYYGLYMSTFNGSSWSGWSAQ